MKRTMCRFGTGLLAVLPGFLTLAQQIEDTPKTVAYTVEGRVQYEDNRDATKHDKEHMTSFWATPGVTITADDQSTRLFLLYKPSLLWRENPSDDQNDSEIDHLVEVNAAHQVSTRLALVATADRAGTVRTEVTLD